MKVVFDQNFYKLYKELNVRIQNRVDKQIRIFQKNPLDPQLNNHELKKEYQGFRSIDITSDYRAIYEEVSEEEEPVAYFTLIGTHKELYKTE